ncbi:hypothetical protein [Paraburkholderia sp. SIMBA_054]|uniref:hypothetical protein n=1 Tax=Paraburkholderia sp. SIMBA_054 TaxID=3085795 RepID=UPI00397949C8
MTNATQDLSHDAQVVAIATSLLAALKEPEFGLLCEAFDAIFDLFLLHPETNLTRLASVPELHRLREAAKTYARERQAELDRADAHARWLAELPSAADLMAQVSAAGDRFEFEGYTLWPENGGWSLTNAYGVDNCAFLSVKGDFEWLLDSVRRGEDLGPIPPYCQEPDDDSPDSRESRFEACLDAASDLLGRLCPQERTIGVPAVVGFDAEDLFSLSLNARVESALMWLRVTGGEVGSEAFDRHRAKAWAFAARAGYLHPEASLPNLLRDDTELEEAWAFGVGVRQSERRATVEELERVRKGLESERLIALRDWCALGLPTPEALFESLRCGERVSVAGHGVWLEDGVVWYENPYGQDGALGSDLKPGDLVDFLGDMARGEEYGPVPY